jgi:hypothetical protein
MASLDSKFRQNLVGQYEKNIPLLKTARQLAPYDAKFRALMDDYIAAAARHEYDAANTGLVNRAASKARAFFATTEPDLPAMLAAAAGSRGPESQTSSQSTAVVEEEARILAEERQNWPNERKAWIAALNRVAAAAKQNPCDDRLRQALAAIYVRGLAMAERRQDAGAVDEIKRIAGALLP